MPLTIHKTWSSLLGIALIVFQTACGASGHASILITAYNAETIKALHQYDQTLRKRRPPLEFKSRTVAETCETYIQAMRETAPDEGVNNQIAKSEYLICDVLAIIGRKNVTGERIGGSAFGEMLAARLDLRSFPSSLFQMLDEKKHTLASIGKGSLQVGATFVTYETPDWVYKLEVVASLDINKNGKPDWVIWLTDKAKTGNYRGYQTLIAYDVTTDGEFRAELYSLHSIIK